MSLAVTINNVSSAEYPVDIDDSELTGIEGRSFRKAIGNGGWVRPAPIFWEHGGKRAVRLGLWKLVSEGNTRWELYDMQRDRTELNDLSRVRPNIVD